MDKHKENKTRISGKILGLVDNLKQILQREPGLAVREMTIKVQGRMLCTCSQGKGEKHILRALKQTPCFQSDNNSTWSISLQGYRENDGVHQLLRSVGQPLNLKEINQLTKKGPPQGFATEKKLMADGRFIRFGDGSWALVEWEFIQEVQDEDLNKIVDHLAGSPHPLSIADLARRVLQNGFAATDLFHRLSGDERFVWVGGDNWHLRSRLPVFRMPDPTDNDPLALLRQGEAAALQEAELFLILQDTDPGSRTYVVASPDLDLGVLRLTKRLQKLFNRLPGLAYLHLQTEDGPQEAWYQQQNQVIFGLGVWFEKRGIFPGQKMKIQKIPGETSVLKLILEEGVEDGVYNEARRLRRFAELRAAAEKSELSVKDIVGEVLQLFPDGLSDERVCDLVGAVRPMEVGAVLNCLHELPYIELNGRNWRFNSEVKVAYDNLQAQLHEVKVQLEKAHIEAACHVEEARYLHQEKKGLEEEVLNLRFKYDEIDSGYRVEIAKLRSENSALAGEVNSLRAELEKVSRVRDSLSEEIKNLKKLHKSSQSEAENYRQKLEGLEVRVVQLQGSLTKTANSSQLAQARLQQKFHDSENRIQSLAAAKEDLQNALEELQRERRELKRRMSPWPVRLVIFLSDFFSGRRPPSTPRKGAINNITR